MLKKFIATVLSFTLIFSMAACGQTSNNSGNKSDNVEVTIPATFLNEQDKDVTLDNDAKEKGIKKIKVNKDGSMTVKMSKKAHEEVLSEMKKSLDEEIKATLEDKQNFPSFSEITYNKDLTEFSIKVDSEIYGGYDAIYSMVLLLNGGIYQSLNSVPDDKLTVIVNIIDQDTGDVIDTINSAQLDESKDTKK